MREIKEELGLDVIEPAYIGTIENIFEWLGRPGHEIVRLYAVRFADPEQYKRTAFPCIEANGERFTCVWKHLADFEREPLYPNGLLGLLRG